MTPTFGFTIPQRGSMFGLGSLPDLLAFAPEAEVTGLFDSVWVGDSLTAKPRPESLALLGALAGMTQHVLLGVACMASFPVREPALFAYQWATLDQISGGRMLLAACTGLVPAEQASQKEGAHFGGVRDAERAQRLEENILICRALWRGERVTFEGRFHSYRDLCIQPQPLQQPCPIWIAANPSPGPFFERSMRRVALMADGWMTVNLFPGAVRMMRAGLARHLQEAGREAEGFPVMAYHNINIGSDRNACLAESKRFLDAYYGPVFTESMVESWVAAGRPGECVAHLRELAGQGTGRVTLRITSWDQKGQFARLVDEVLPALVSG